MNLHTCAERIGSATHQSMKTESECVSIVGIPWIGGRNPSKTKRATTTIAKLHCSNYVVLFDSALLGEQSTHPNTFAPFTIAQRICISFHKFSTYVNTKHIRTWWQKWATNYYSLIPFGVPTFTRKSLSDATGRQNRPGSRESSVVSDFS